MTLHPFNFKKVVSGPGHSAMEPLLAQLQIASLTESFQ